MFGPVRTFPDAFGHVRMRSEAFGSVRTFSDFFENFRHFLTFSRFCQKKIRESRVLEELGIFERHWQIRRRKPVPVVRLFFLYDPWRRGKRVETCF